MHRWKCLAILTYVVGCLLCCTAAGLGVAAAVGSSLCEGLGDPPEGSNECQRTGLTIGAIVVGVCSAVSCLAALVFAAAYKSADASAAPKDPKVTAQRLEAKGRGAAGSL